MENKDLLKEYKKIDEQIRKHGIRNNTTVSKPSELDIMRNNKIKNDNIGIEPLFNNKNGNNPLDLIMNGNLGIKTFYYMTDKKEY